MHQAEGRECLPFNRFPCIFVGAPQCVVLTHAATLYFTT